MFSSVPETNINFSATSIWSSANAFIWDEPKILLFGKELIFALLLESICGACICAACICAACICAACICAACTLCGLHLCGLYLCGLHLCGLYLCALYLWGLYQCGLYLCGLHRRTRVRVNHFWSVFWVFIINPFPNIPFSDRPKFREAADEKRYVAIKGL